MTVEKLGKDILTKDILFELLLSLSISTEIIKIIVYGHFIYFLITVKKLGG